MANASISEYSKNSLGADRLFWYCILILPINVVVVLSATVVNITTLLVAIYMSKVSFTWSFNNSLTSSLLPTNSYTQEAGKSTIT